MAFTILTSLVTLSGAHATNPQNLTFQVNIDEVLTVAVTDPTTWASGDLVCSSGSAASNCVSGFLRNKVNVSAITNNGAGVKVHMFVDHQELRNLTSYSASDASTYIPTVSSAVQPGNNGEDFAANFWGYSTDDVDNYSAATAVNPTSHYSTLPLRAAPVKIIDTSTTGGANEDVYFGAKADGNKQSGTYAQTVYFAAITGNIDTDNPAVPVNPAGPNPTNEIAQHSNTGVGTGGQTTYTTRTSTGSGTDPITGSKDTTTTNVTKGDTTSTYANAAGVTTSSNNAAALATALGVSAVVTATSGAFFFVAAKRRKDDDEEEEE